MTAFEFASFGIFIYSVILHEIAHGAVALGLGDDTAKRSGRLTLNPVPHIDPVGSILLPGLLLLSHAGLLFGWAKPVPVNTARLHSPRNDAVLTGLAGPATNLVLVGCSLAALRIFHPVTYWPVNLLVYLGLINLLLALFNLIPIPPLDGSSVVERLVPSRWWGQYLAIRPYTMLLVLGLVVIGYSTHGYEDAVTWLTNRFLTAAGY